MYILLLPLFLLLLRSREFSSTTSCVVEKHFIYGILSQRYTWVLGHRAGGKFKCSSVLFNIGLKDLNRWRVLLQTKSIIVARRQFNYISGK